MAVTELNNVEVLRTGSFTDMHGRIGEFGISDLHQIAKDYNPEEYESPLVLGHPKTDSPAYGWLKALRVVGDRLVGDYHYVQDAVRQALENRSFKNRSLKLSKNADGKWTVWHTGLLGAVLPAVDGLKPITLAGEDSEALEFEFAAVTEVLDIGEIQMIEEVKTEEVKPLELGYEDNIMVSLWRNLREMLVRSNVTQALIDQYLPMDMIDNLAMAVQQTQTQEAVEDYKESMEDAEENDEPLGGMTMAATQSEQPAKPDNTEQLLEFAAMVEGLVREGKVLPAERAGLLRLSQRISAQTYELSSSDGTKQEYNDLQILSNSLKARKPIVPVGNAVKHEETADKIYAFSAPDGFSVSPESAEAFAKAKAMQAANPDIDLVKTYVSLGGK